MPFGDNYNLNNSHFIPAILRKKYMRLELKKIIMLIFGGLVDPKREVIHADDLAAAVVYFMNKNVKHSLINIGISKEFSIKQYANQIIKILNLRIKVNF